MWTQHFLYKKVADKHAPIRKFTVKKRKALWIDEELKALMAKRDQMKMVSIKCSLTPK